MDSRREHVPFDPRFFEKHEHGDEQSSPRELFRRIYRTNHWSGDESVSGEGSGHDQTQVLKTALPELLARLDVDVLLDIPCGDFSWMQHVDLPVSQYVGADIVPELIEHNRRRYSDEHHRFVTLDLTSAPLPDADMLLCRDGLVHLSFADIQRALENLRKSSITYLLATTFPEEEENEDAATGDWRPLNLQRPPFNFPDPMELIVEHCTEGGGRFQDKSLGLWRIDELPILDL